LAGALSFARAIRFNFSSYTASSSLHPGPTGYVLYWQLSELGVKCEVVAPTLVL